MVNAKSISLFKSRSLIFSLVFVALSVALPQITHFFGGPALGRALLPMQFFVFLSGLLLGWRSGLAVGILTPLLSFSLTGMPLAAVLPFIIIELASYGVLAGIFHKGMKLDLWPSILGAMLFGRLILWVGLLILPTKLMATSYLTGVISVGLPGMIAQLVLLPIIYEITVNYLDHEKI